MPNLGSEKGKTFLNKTRILGEQIFEDSRAFLSRVYKQSSSVFSPASPFGQLLRALGNLGELILSYLEDAQVENNPKTATNIESIIGNSELAGHDPTRAISAVGEVRFKFRPGKESDFTGPHVILPQKVKLKSLNNELTYTIQFNSDQFRVNKGEIDFSHASIVQGEFESQQVIGTGKSMQSFNINVEGNPEHYNIRVFVNGEIWPVQASIYDMVGNNKQAVKIRSGLAGGIDILFGNGFFGEVPPFGSIIEVEYLLSDGTSGTINSGASDSSFEFIDTGLDNLGEEVDLNEFLIIETVKSPGLSGDPEDPEFTKVIAPLASKSFVLAGPSNYEHFLARYNSFSYIDAFNTVEDDFLDDDNVTFLFIVPDIKRKLTSDTDYFTVDQTEFTLDNFEKDAILRAINESGNQATSSEVRFVDPTVTRYSMNIVLRYFDSGDKNIIAEDIRQSLNDYFLSVRRRDKIPKSDLIAVIENIDGVDSVNVFFISEANEKAITDGFYITKTFKVTPTVPFLQEGEGQKKRFVFFNKELIEKKIIVPVGEDPQLGLDQFGDISIGKNELPILRGGWADRDGVIIEEFPTRGKPSALSIYFKDKITETVSTRVQTQNRKKLT